MSCPRFPYGRFNFGISNKKLYPRTNNCSNRLWTLTLKDTVQNSRISIINIPKNTKITQEISRRKKGIIYNDVVTTDTIITFLSDSESIFEIKDIKFESTVYSDIKSDMISSLTFTDIDSSAGGVVFTQNDEGNFFIDGKKYISTGFSGSTFVLNPLRQWTPPPFHIARDINKKLKQKNIFQNTHKLTKSEIYALYSRNRFNR